MDQTMADDVRNRMLFEGARTGPPENWPALPDIPLARYTSDDFYAREMKVFKSQWLLVGHTSELAEPGSYRVLNVPFAPIILVRDKTGILRAFLNACRHRGAPVVRCGEGTTKYLVCQFHSWAYALDGSLVNVTERRDFVESVLEDRGLTPVRLESWGGMVFINLDPDAAPLLDSLRPLAARFSQFAEAPLRVVRRQTREIKANWKVIVEAFLESYHVNTVHPQTVAQLLETRDGAMMLYENGHSSMYVPYRAQDEGTFNFLLPLPAIEGLNDWYTEANVSNLIFPNVILPLEASGFPGMTFWPLAKDRTLYEEIWFGVDWGQEERPPAWDLRLAGWDYTVEEDVLNLEPMQVAVESAAHAGVPLSYQERRIWQFHHELDKAIGAEHIPAELRIPDLLGHLVEPAIDGAVELPAQPVTGTANAHA
jgi:phenylpropionate dioxygenase-like ring-hydroxylating dioxygenase large terminal subunit